MAAPRIIVVGGGLAGLAAVIKIAEAGGKVDLFSIVPVKRSHSVCAQGGINAAKNTRARATPPTCTSTTRSTAATSSRTSPPSRAWRRGARHHLPARPHGRALQPHPRGPARLPPLRRHALPPHRVRRRDHRPAAPLRPRRAGAPLRSPKARSRSSSSGSSSPPSSTKRRLPRHHAPWTCASMEARTFPADAVILATGGPGAIFGKSTNSVINTGTAQSPLYQQGAIYANGEFIQVHPTAIPGDDKLRLMSESARGEGGRVWVPRSRKATSAPAKPSPRASAGTSSRRSTRSTATSSRATSPPARSLKVVYEHGLGIDGKPRSTSTSPTSTARFSTASSTASSRSTRSSSATIRATSP